MPTGHSQAKGLEESKLTTTKETKLTRRKETMAEAHGIVIVGGGICGLATALGLHR